jgi:Bacterial Ig-like domain (group 3)
MLKRQGAAAAAAAYRRAGLSPALSHTLLPYNGGPVMHTSTVHTIFWLPSGYSFGAVSDANYESLINRFFTDLSGSQFYDILTQYPDTTAPLTHTIAFGGSYVDTTAYPCGSTCGSTSPGQFLSDSDIQNAVLRATKAEGWQPGQSNQYLVFYGSGVVSCASFGCSTNAFCAYHGQFTGNNGSANGQWIYSNMYDAGTDPGCALGQGTPNNDQVADNEISTASHEMSESITDLDPLGATSQGQAWQNAAPGPSGFGGEIGDLCAYVWRGNTTLNGNTYAIQSEWSNYNADCVNGDSIPTSVTYTGPTNANPGSVVTLTATLNDGNGAGVGEQTVTISLGSQSCQGTTDFAVPGTSQGHASCQITLNQSPGSYSVAAHYAGGIGAYQSSDSAATTFTILKQATTLAYTGPTSGDYNDPVTLTATLTNTATNAGISGETVSFGFGAESCSGTTDGNGVASCTVTPTDSVAGSPYPITASFAGDTDYKPSSDSSTSFTVNLEDTTLTAPATQLLLATGKGATLTSTLTDPQEGAAGDGAPIAGKSVTMQVGTSGPSCTATTNAGGVATCTTAALPASVQGPQTITDTFTSDGNYAGATASQSAIAFTYLASGTFDLGNVSVTNATATTPLTWWADTWSSLNSLSGGKAPSGFKGFAPNLFSGGHPTTQLTCGDTFTYNTTGGNSSSPPATVPAYMAVAVSSSIKKSGNVISGNVPKVVIVQTQPGYKPMPVNHGTGFVVATICGS